MYYKTLDENFAHVISLFETDQTSDELFEYLKSGNIVQRQVSVIKLNSIESFEEAQILVSNLTGQDGKIREVVSQKIKEFCSNEKFLPFFKQTEIYKTLLNSITDINGNICRNIISIISLFSSDKIFEEYFIPELLIMTKSLIEKVKQFDYKEGKYKVNKEAFKLYWCLEAIYELFEIIDLENLKQILICAKDIKDYTIREKIAKILTKDFEDKELQKLKEELHNDENYYVRRYF